MKDTWIWLPKEKYHLNQTTRYNTLGGAPEENYTVAEFKRSYIFEKQIKKVHLRVSGDTAFQLFCNEKMIATGPASVGGDFLNNDHAREWFYATEFDIEPNGNELSFFSRVQMMPVQLCEFSKGHGGFMLAAAVYFQDDSCEYITTDKEWLVRLNRSYLEPCHYDETVSPDSFVLAEETEDIWNAEKSLIPPRSEAPIVFDEITLAPHEDVTIDFPLDMIYAGFAYLNADIQGPLSVELAFRELDVERKRFQERVTFTGSGEYRGFYLHSAGLITAHLKNDSDADARIAVGLITTHYPVDADAETLTNDAELNEVLRVCKHTLKYCRQTHHLDSPRHCEPLACTGDYYIESLMTAFSFGDMRLAEFDVLRTAELLRHNDGKMFHTTYSLIWVRMLYDVYMMGGNYDMLMRCRDALDLLLNRFDGYIGDNDLIEYAPDYMFVDWIYIDGISMHHPPKALGQTVLNMFYFMALSYAERVYTLLGDMSIALRCHDRANKLKKAINAYLYDAEKEMYFEGLNTPVEESLIKSMHPQNIDKRYYLKHSNIMAVYTSVCDDETAKILIDKIMSDDIEGDVQPYFLHYLLEAIYTHGLREQYTLKLIERWKPSVKECSKGLAEGFVAPEPTYHFDHSHAWGGTPLYSLPKALLGLSVDEPSYRKITLSPSLLGLDNARIELPTPYGMIVCEMKRGSLTKITAPDEVTVQITN